MKKNTTIKDQEISEDELHALTLFQGKKLGFLIYALNIDDEPKQSLIDLLPAMSLEQLAKLTDLLEAQLLHQKSSEADGAFRENLQQIVNKYNKTDEASDQETHNKLEALGEEIDRLTKRNN